MSKSKNYLYDLGYEVKLRALEARQLKHAAAVGSEDRMFHAGRLMAFNEVISIMQQQAEGFGIPLTDLRLEEIDPDRDLT